MPTISIELPETVTVKGAGAETEIRIADYTQEALEYIFTYGLGRAHQDRANAIRHKLRESGEKVDGDAILADVARRLAAGEINQRGSGGGMSAEEVEFRRVVAELVRGSDPAEWKAASNDYKTKLVDRRIAAMDADAAEAVREEARERLEEKRRKDERKAKLAKMAKV